MNKIFTSTKQWVSALTVASSMLFFTGLLLTGTTTHAQVVYSESFDAAGPFPNIDLPVGWTQGKFCGGVGGWPANACNDPDNGWDRFGVGATNASCNPRSGIGMMRFQARIINAGEKSWLSSKRLDMTNLPAGGAAGSVWIYRENGFTTSLDSITVYANTTPGITGAAYPTGSRFLTAGIPRYCGAAPIFGCVSSSPYNAAGWYQVNFTLPYIAPFIGSNSVYITIMATSRNGNNIYIDDFTIDTYPKAEQLYVPNSAAVVIQNSATTAPNQTNQSIIAFRIRTDGAVSPGNALGLKDLTFNTNGSTNPVSDITTAKLWWTGGSNVFDATSALLIDTYNNPHFTNFTMLATPWTGLEVGDNYFWITYDLPVGANTGNFVDAEFVSFYTTRAVSPFTQSGLLSVAPVSLPGARLIDIPYCVGTYTAGTSWANYTNNDYVASVILAGDQPPGINNIYNTNGPGLPWCANPCRFSAHPPDYEFFPPTLNKTAVLTVGSTYMIEMQVGTWFSSNYIAAWIDYNRVNGFETPSERLGGNSPAIAANGWYRPNFTVPLTAVPGNARLRVREVYASSNITPCGHYTWGETEDYIVTILPQCAPAWPGWKTWLGFTNDWDNPANWCGGVPSPADNARIPQGGTGPNDRPGNFDPVIKSGVVATTNILQIEANAAVNIDAAIPGQLAVSGELLIQNNTSSLIVNSTFNDEAVVSNGVLAAPTVAASNSAFKNSPKSKSIWLFNQSELLAEGMLVNDVVTNLQMQVQRNSTNNVPFKNVTIRIWYTNATPAPVGFRFNGTGDMPPIVGPAPVTVFTGDVLLSSFIPTQGDWGIVDFPLIPGSFVWNGSTNKLVVEMCYDNEGFATPNAFDGFRYTQTAGIQNYINIFNTKDNFNYPACTMVPSFSINASGIITGVIGTNTLNVTSPTVGKLAVGQWVQGLGVNVAQTVNGNHAIGSLIINMNSTVGIQVGHYINHSNGSQVVAVGATSITLSHPITAAANNGITLNFRPAITNIAGTTVTLSANLVAAVSGTYNFGTLNTLPGVGIDYRPNIIFKFDRPYQQYPITVLRNWTNNGNFVPGFSVVSMGNNSPIPAQIMGGTNPSNFYDLKIDNNAHVTLNQNITVSDTLYLQNGRLKLNNRLLTLSNNAITALRRVNGGLQSDSDVLGSDVAPYGRVRWNMGSGLGTRTIPFINAAGEYLPLNYNIDAGTHDVTFATYATPPNNLNMPAPVTSITQIIVPGTTWSTDGSGIVDRYYMIDNTAGSGGPQADINFRYATGERANVNSQMRAQRWINAAGQWDLLPFSPGQTHIVGSPDLVSLPNFNQFSSSQWWTIVGEPTPLPVSLLSFNAKPFKDKVKLEWVTASEYNSSHFEVERTVDNEEFSFIDRVQSRGPSTSNIEYHTWDLNPVEGTQYYYLRQHDIDGRFESFGPVAATFSRDLFDIVTVAISPTEMGLSVVFNYDSSEPYSYRIVDMTGRVVIAKDRNPGEPGMNVIDIDAKLSKGAYQIMLQNSKKVVARKFFY